MVPIPGRWRRGNQRVFMGIPQRRPQKGWCCTEFQRFTDRGGSLEGGMPAGVVRGGWVLARAVGLRTAVRTELDMEVCADGPTSGCMQGHKQE